MLRCAPHATLPSSPHATLSAPRRACPPSARLGSGWERARPPSARPASPRHPPHGTLPTAGPPPHLPTSPPRRPTKSCCRAATCACAPRASRASSSSARSAASRAPRRTPSTPDRHAPRRQEKTRSAKIVCKDSRVPAPARARAAASCAAGEQPPPPRAPVAPQTGCAQHVPWQGGAEAARARWVAWARFAHDGLSWVRTRDVLVR